MLINHPHHSPYYAPSHHSPSSQPVRYVVARSASDRPYPMVPCYQYQMLPVYYMPVSYGYNEKPQPHYRRVNFVSSSSVGDYIPSDIDLATSWEYQQSSDWSPQGDQGELSPNNDLSLPYTDWERQEEMSSQDLSPRASPSPISAISVSELEARLEAASLDQPQAADVDVQDTQSESVFPVYPTNISYDRDLILKLKRLKSDSPARQILGQVESPCVETLYSSTSTFNDCADVIMRKKVYATPALISAFEEMMDEYSLDPEQMPWFVLRVMIYVRYKAGKSFDSEKIANGKEVCKHFTAQAHAFFAKKIRDECLEALEDEESGLTLSKAYSEFVTFLPDS